MLNEQYSPEHIHEVFVDDDVCHLFLGGSNYWFGKFEDYEVIDYDYFIFKKSDRFYISRLEDPGADIKVFEYIASLSPKETVESIFKEKKLPVCLLYKQITDFLGITFDDVKEYLPELKSNLITYTEGTKYGYYIKLVEYIIQNESFELTDEQLLDVYNCYKECKNYKASLNNTTYIKRKDPSYIEVKINTDGTIEPIEE